MSGGHITDGRWKQVKGRTSERWGELTDDEYREAQGSIDQLAGKIQEKYGHAREDVKDFLDRLRDDDDS